MATTLDLNDLLQQPLANPQPPTTNRRAAVIVAHPDDEILWAGGLILANPSYRWFILSLTRRSDPDRAPRFHQVLSALGATGSMDDLDDSPGQSPLDPALVEQAVLGGLDEQAFDLVVTHGENGEYTFHQRHVEVSRSVTSLWTTGQIQAPVLWHFAYADQGRGTLPRAVPGSDVFLPLPSHIFREKRRLVTQCYGFDPSSWEAQAVPPEEAFRIIPRPTMPGDAS